MVVPSLLRSDVSKSLLHRILQKQKMEEVVVMYPSPDIGHLISMVELAKLIINNRPSFTVIILTTTPPFNTGSTAPYIRRVSATTPSITFHHLPPNSFPYDPNSYPSHAAATFDFFRLNIPNVRKALQTISTPISAFIVDLFCTPAIPIAVEFNIPAYCFFTSGAGVLACYLYLPTIHLNTTQSFRDLEENLSFPGLPPIPAADMPTPLLDRDSMEYNFFVEFCALMSKTAGIITNTFEWLEPRFVKAVSDGLCVPDGPTPPNFCVGPLIATHDGGSSDGGDRPECLAWLDSQPSSSVVFLCFGSRGFFSAEQLKEIAIGLEKSGQRFLWVVRSPPPAKNSEILLESTEPDLNKWLPEGFLERTKEKGLVVKSWAPQVEVLSHDSVGGFVTHCGWNSVLEAVSAGVPMVAWPLYSEQRLNKILLVEELKLALPLTESAGRFVTATELGNRVKELMETEAGESVRSKAGTAREGAMAAATAGGSSLVAFAKLVESWKRN